MSEQQPTPDPAATYQAAMEAFAPTLPCWRATGIIDLLIQAGQLDAAERWGELHAWSWVNDEHDPHRGGRWAD